VVIRGPARGQLQSGALVWIVEGVIEQALLLGEEVTARYRATPTGPVVDWVRGREPTMAVSQACYLWWMERMDGLLASGQPPS
jgi:hypothetical protein